MTPSTRRCSTPRATDAPGRSSGCPASSTSRQWRATDIAGAWFVERGPDGATWQTGSRPADVTVTGPAGSLLLTLTRRLPLPDGQAVDGDAGLAQHWLDNTAHVSD